MRRGLSHGECGRGPATESRLASPCPNAIAAALARRAIQRRHSPRVQARWCGCGHNGNPAAMCLFDGRRFQAVHAREQALAAAFAAIAVTIAVAAVGVRIDHARRSETVVVIMVEAMPTVVRVCVWVAVCVIVRVWRDLTGGRRYVVMRRGPRTFQRHRHPLHG